MVKKIGSVLSLCAMLVVQAQDISTIRNTTEVYSNNASNGSSKYQGMAGSMGALGGDYSVLHSNPAGLGVSVANDVSVTLGLNNYKSKTTFSGQTADYKTTQTDLANAGGIISFRTPESSKWKFVNIGINYSYQPLDNYIESPADNSYQYISNTDVTLAYNGHAYNRYGNASKMSIGVGTNYDNKFYLGAGLHLHSAVLDQYDTASYTLPSGSVDFYNKQSTPFSETADGFSANVGVIGKVNNNFRLGLAVETPTWWRISRGYNYYDDPYYGDGNAVEDRNLRTPLKTTFSAAYVAGKSFSINVDYALGLTKPHYKEYGAAEEELNDFFSSEAKNFSEFKIGAEYRLAQFRLRGGYALAMSPFDNFNVTTVNNGNASYDNFILGQRNTLALGLGYDFKSFYIDAAYQNVSSKFANPYLQGDAAYSSGYYATLPNENIIENGGYFVSDSKLTRNNVTVTVGWKF